MKNRVRRKLIASGFTLVELMVTVAIVGILIAVAVPSFDSLLSTNTAEAAADRLTSSLAYARSEAVTRSANVTVCSKADGANTCATGTDSNDWSNGWLTYIEDAAGGTDSVDSDGNADDLLLKVEDLSTLILSRAADDGGVSSIVFDSLGERSIPASGDFALEFVGSDGEAVNGMTVSVSTRGVTDSTLGTTE